MLEAEWAFTQSVDDVCQVVEGAIKEVIRCGDKDMALRDTLLNISYADRPWTRMSYTDAVSELEKYHESSTKKFAFPPAWGKTLQSEHERWLADELVRGPVFVTDYPVSLKPFYMRLNDDGKTVACFDLLVPRVGELVGGSLREERLSHLKQALDAHGLSREEYGWYLDLRKYGSAPHGGFGLGFERLIGWLSGIENVRECIPMPRWAGRMLL
jgi:asparaginyl-tRNA synthetase